MTPRQKERIRAVFLAACEKDPQERPAFLLQACQGDECLRREVESLLANDKQADGFLQTPALGRTFADAHLDSFFDEAAPATAGNPDAQRTAARHERIGSYRILDEVGRGGMGIVYRAEQDNPRRRVALKLIPPGAATPALLRRFEHEAQILGRLQHPGIAQVYEAGTADTGSGPQPFFAMELVDGTPLTSFAKTQQLGLRDRLQLFAKICDAVQHAHQKGVIHRDLKPSNILVTEEGQPKILDFGIARAIDSDVQVTTMRTDVGQLIGTISYMSPEQAMGDPDELDTRSDIYALGVVLYELLTGQLPFELGRKMIHDAVRIIHEEEPTRLSSIDRVFRGDVETIVAKAMEKDRTRRYQSASDLAGDIRRFLANEPITARAPTTLYQLRKFARRNKTVVATIVVAFAALGAAFVEVARERDRALDAERVAHIQTREAERQAAIAKAVNEFLNEDLLAATDPTRTPNREITMREVLDVASERIVGKFVDEPETAASVHRTLGTTYEHLGEYEAAEPHFEQALKLYREALGDRHLYVFDAMEDLALIRRRQARYSEAEELFTEALSGKRKLLGNQHFETAVSMNDLAALYHTQGRHEEAERLYLESLAVRRRLFGEQHEETAACECNLANLYEVLGRYDEAVAMHVRALETRKRTLGEEHPQTLMSMNSLAKAYNSRKEYDLAEPLWRKVMEARRNTLGKEHPETLKTMNNLAVLFKECGRHAEAEALWDEVLAAQRRLLGEKHPHTLVSACNLADLYTRMERFEEAAALLSTTIAGARESLPEGHWYTGVFLTKHGMCLTSLQRFEEAEAALDEAHRILSASLGADHDRTKTAATALASLYDAWGKPADAAEWQTRSEATAHGLDGGAP